MLLRVIALSLAISVYSIVAGGVIGLAQEKQIRPAAEWVLAKRKAMAISYIEGESSSVAIAGTFLFASVRGRVDARRKYGRTEVRVRLTDLPHPQALNADYTSYVIWAILPDGQAESLAQLPIAKDYSAEIDIATLHQTFGLIVTAEPHPMVKYPGPVVIAENTPPKDRRTMVGSIEYRGDPGTFYTALYRTTASSAPDYKTPLSVLGARRAIDIAWRAAAGQYAAVELRQAESQLGALERLWPQYRVGKRSDKSDKEDQEEFRDTALEVMRLAESARSAAVDRSAQARQLEAERAMVEAAERARVEAAERARVEAERAAAEARRKNVPQNMEDYRAAIARHDAELAQAVQRAEQGATVVERMEAREEIVQLETARAEMEQARRERIEPAQRLQSSISDILEMRREARGMVVSLSDALFDLDRASLVAEAKASLGRLVSMLLKYPVDYRIEIEGHVDAAGSEAGNQKLSEERAAAVRDCLLQSGLPADRILNSKGLGKTRPLATNDTSVGRYINRRVEIIIIEPGGQAAVDSH